MLLSKNSSINSSKFCRSSTGSSRLLGDKDFRQRLQLCSSCLAAIVAAFAANKNISIDVLVILFHSSNPVLHGLVKSLTSFRRNAVTSNDYSKNIAIHWLLRCIFSSET